MPSFLYQVENDRLTCQTVFEAPRTPQFSIYPDIPLVPVRLDLPTHNMDSVSFSPNDRHKKQGSKRGSRWSYSQLDTGMANTFEPMDLCDLKGNDSKFEPDTSFPPKSASLLGTPNYGTLDDEMALLKTPSPSLFNRLSLNKPLRKQRFLRHYEVPKWSSLIIHAFLCLLSFPILLAFVKIAEGRTLFWARAIVGIGSGITGLLLGRSLLLLSVRHLEATGESATVSLAV